MEKTKKEHEAEQKALAEKNKAAVHNAENKKKHEEELEKAAEKNQKESVTPKTETVAKIDAATDEALALAKEKASGTANYSGDLLGLGEMATSEQWTTDDHGRRSHPNDVKFHVKYPSGWKGAKSMEDGSIQVVSLEVAEQLSDLGIGKIIK